MGRGGETIICCSKKKKINMGLEVEVGEMVQVRTGGGFYPATMQCFPQHHNNGVLRPV